MAPRLLGDHILVNSLHPGIINTPLLRKGWAAMGAATGKAAEGILQSLNNQTLGNSGDYFVDARPAPPASIAEDRTIQEVCWNLNSGLI